MHKCRRCGVLAGALTLGLGLLFLPLAKGSVDGALEKEASAALADAGVDGVSVDANWASLNLNGPAASEEAARKAVANMPHFNAVNKVDYNTGNQATIDGVVSRGVDVQFRPVGAPARIELTGTVSSEADRKALVEAAKAAHPESEIDDQLQVQNVDGSATGEPVKRLAGLIGAFAPNVSDGNASLRGNEITVTGTAVDEASALKANEALERISEGEGAVIVAGSIMPAEGSAPVATGDVQSAIDELVKLEPIRFKINSGEIQDGYSETLDRVAKILNDNPDLKIAIEGHTDNRGGTTANQNLSTFRAESVRAYLISKGVSGDRMTTAGFGEDKPVATNDTEEGRQQNRRIEFIVKEGM